MDVARWCNMNLSQNCLVMAIKKLVLISSNWRQWCHEDTCRIPTTQLQPNISKCVTPRNCSKILTLEKTHAQYVLPLQNWFYPNNVVSSWGESYSKTSHPSLQRIPCQGGPPSDGWEGDSRRPRDMQRHLVQLQGTCDRTGQMEQCSQTRDNTLIPCQLKKKTLKETLVANGTISVLCGNFCFGASSTPKILYRHANIPNVPNLNEIHWNSKYMEHNCA